MAKDDITIGWEEGALEAAQEMAETLRRHTEALESFLARDPSRDVIHAIEVATVKVEPGDTLIINFRDPVSPEALERMQEAAKAAFPFRCLITNFREGLELGMVKL